jgi:hypothetical protein
MWLWLVIAILALAIGGLAGVFLLEALDVW